MSKLDQLPEITDHVLSGLHADDSLKFRIYQKASASNMPERRVSKLHLAALCAISAVMIAVFVILAGIPLNQQKQNVQIHTIQAGTELDRSPLKPDDTADTADTADQDIDADETEIETIRQNVKQKILERLVTGG